MGKNTGTNLNGRSIKPEELENGSAYCDYSATSVGLHIGPILMQRTRNYLCVFPVEFCDVSKGAW